MFIQALQASETFSERVNWVLPDHMLEIAWTSTPDRILTCWHKGLFSWHRAPPLWLLAAVIEISVCLFSSLSHFWGCDRPRLYQVAEPWTHSSDSAMPCSWVAWKSDYNRQSQFLWDSLWNNHFEPTEPGRYVSDQSLNTTVLMMTWLIILISNLVRCSNYAYGQKHAYASKHIN